MNILLVHPKDRFELFSSRSVAPMWAAVLKRLTPESHNVDFISCGFERLNEKTLEGYDLVGISATTPVAHSAYEIAGLCRTKNIKVIIGGLHASLLPDEVAKYADSIVFGESEYLWNQILEDKVSDKLQQYYHGSIVKAEDIAIPDYSIMKKYNYFTTNSIEAMRGCPNACDFCCATYFSGNTIRYKPLDLVIQEVESWKTKKVGYLASANIASNFNKAKELFTTLKPFNRKWMGDACVNVTGDDELLKLMSDSGLAYLEVGFETLSKKSLKLINKKINLKHDYKDAIKRLHDNNISIVGTFIFGLDTDEKDVFKKTMDFVYDAEIDIPVYLVFTPFPGTKPYSKLDAEGRILTKDWSRYTGLDVVYQPKMMSREELLAGLIEIWEDALSFRGIANRLLSQWRGFKGDFYFTVINLFLRNKSKFLKKYYPWEGIDLPDHISARKK
ncbi:MAG: B12-binding domain-containing radical SAM protein [Thermoplasmata archaeon]|nr:MAG: B12-binding domain-containing radical SAM protein [Thermoplasmata archaeon]